MVYVFTSIFVGKEHDDETFVKMDEHAAYVALDEFIECEKDAGRARAVGHIFAADVIHALQSGETQRYIFESDDLSSNYDDGYSILIITAV